MPPLVISELNEKRLRISKIFIFVAFSTLLIRLWFLQCFYGSYYRDKSENNRIRTIRTAPQRGDIRDADDRRLVTNIASFNASLMVEDTDKPYEVVKEIANITGRDSEKVLAEFKSDKQSRRFEPKPILKDISREDMSKIKAQIYRFPSIIIETIPKRLYPENGLASQVLGYVREVNKNQLTNLVDEGYVLGDVLGQSGLEKKYESTLRGYSGFEQIEVDANGRRRGKLGVTLPIVGQDIYLNLDKDLQEAGEEALKGKRGAIVALNPENGAVLAIVSVPTFDSNLFSGSISAKEWDEIIKDTKKPMLNRAISQVYPPGSTSKLLWAIAGLHSGKITKNTMINCPGYFSLGSRKYMCHKKTGHGPVNLETAITVSCNAYFYNLGQSLGITEMTDYLRMFRFGSTTGIDLPEEQAGILAGEEWKLKRYNKRWYPGDTVPVSIGQGYFVASPIQLATLAMIIANDGKIYAPQLVKAHYSRESNTIIPQNPKLISELTNIPKEIFQTVRELGASVVENKRGTGSKAALPGIRVGGKTGTAQVGKVGMDKISNTFQDHAWFISYAPVEKPLIALSVIVENSGHGGEFAAPVAKKVMEVFFKKNGMLKEDSEIENKEIDSKNPIEEDHEHIDLEEDLGEPEFAEDTFNSLTTDR